MKRSNAARIALAYAWLGHAGREALAGGDGTIRNAMPALALLAFIVFLPRLARRWRRDSRPLLKRRTTP